MSHYNSKDPIKCLVLCKNDKTADNIATNFRDAFEGSNLIKLDEVFFD